MSFSRVPPVAAFVLVLAFVAGCASLGYARWARPMFDADRALAAGNAQAALAAYSVAESRFGRFLVTRQVFTSEYNRAVYNQLALLYAAGDYDAVLEKSAAAPDGAAPRFWSGSALLTRAIAEKKPDARLVLLSRAEEELKQALQAAPSDWDTKVNYEIAARLAAQLRRQPGKMADPLMQLLRPQPMQGQPTRKVG